jgi:hypothetical protein
VLVTAYQAAGGIKQGEPVLSRTATTPGRFPGHLNTG